MPGSSDNYCGLKRISKNLWTNTNQGNPVYFYEAYNDDDECSFIVDKIESPGCGILPVEPWLWNPVCGILAVESWRWSPGYGVLAVKFWLWNPGCGVLAVESWSLEPGVWCQASGAWNLELGF